MALKIRLARGGSKKRPYYRIVVAEATAPRDGKFVEKVGTYNPLLEGDHAARCVLDSERVSYWLGVGAKPTERVQLFLSRAGLIASPKISDKTKKAQPKKKAQQRLKEAAEALAAANEASAPAVEENPAA